MAKFLVMDTGGMHVGTAAQLGKQGHEVMYYNPWQSTYANFLNYAPGMGLKEIKKVGDPGPYYDKVDCIMFPDVGMGDTASWLRKKGYRVFGASRGEEIEQDRGRGVDVLQKVGIKVPKTHRVKGISEALKKIDELVGKKTETNQMASGKVYAKINTFRGDMDTFPISSMREARYVMNKLNAHVGPFAEDMPIFVQESVSGEKVFECGGDLFFDGQRWAMPAMIGFENGKDYAGKLVMDVGPMKEDLDKIAEYFSEVGYRGPFSFEALYDGKDFWWIDPTCRYGMPLSMAYTQFPGYGDLIMNVASSAAQSSGMPAGKWIGGASVNSENGISEWLPLNGDNAVWLKYMESDGQKYSVPGDSTLGFVPGQGDSIAELQADVNDKAKDVSVFFGSVDSNFGEAINEKYVKRYLDAGLKLGD